MGEYFEWQLLDEVFLKFFQTAGLLKNDGRLAFFFLLFLISLLFVASSIHVRILVQSCTAKSDL